jgi:hypothetical protein
MTLPDTIWLFRMIHIQNLEYILVHGLHTIHSRQADPNFLSIGDLSLIDYRKEKMDIPIEPYGGFSEYIPFYLGTRQPMLYKIATGWEEIEEYPQSDIIYIVSTLDLVEDHDLEYVFTDGHARAKITNFYNARSELKKLDWKAIYAKNWGNTPEDPDKMNRKQSEFMVKNFMPTTCIERLLVYTEKTKARVRNLCYSTGNATLDITVTTKPYYDNI